MVHLMSPTLKQHWPKNADCWSATWWTESHHCQHFSHDLENAAHRHDDKRVQQEHTTHHGSNGDGNSKYFWYGVSKDTTGKYSHIYRYICVCVYTYTHTQMHIYTHTYTYIIIHIHVYIFISTLANTDQYHWLEDQLASSEIYSAIFLSITPRDDENCQSQRTEIGSDPFTGTCSIIRTDLVSLISGRMCIGMPRTPETMVLHSIYWRTHKRGGKNVKLVAHHHKVAAWCALL